MGENDHMKIKKDLSQMGMYTFVTSFLVRYFFMIWTASWYKFIIRHYHAMRELLI